MSDFSIFYVFVQALGILAMGLEIWGTRYKDDRKMILWAAASAGVYVVHFICLGAFAGAAADALGALRCVASQYKKSAYLSFVFVLAYVAFAFFTADGLIDMLPFIGGMISTLAMFHLSGIRMRAVFILTIGLWFIYTVYYFSIGGMLLCLFLTIGYMRTILKMRHDDVRDVDVMPL